MIPCLVVDMPGGGRAIVKLAPQRRKLCQFCRQGKVTKLCDFKLTAGDVGHVQTCDAGMCDRCAYPVALNVDYCPNHKPAKD